MPYSSPAPGRRITPALLSNMLGVETSFTPTWSADSGTTTLGNGTLTGSYRVLGSRCEFNVEFNWGSTTTQSIAGSEWRFSLPVAPSTVVGNTFTTVDVWIFDTSANSRWQAAGYVSGTNSRVETIIVNADQTAMTNNEMPDLTAHAASTTSVRPGSLSWANGDRLNIKGSYEIA